VRVCGCALVRGRPARRPWGGASDTFGKFTSDTFGILGIMGGLEGARLIERPNSELKLAHNLLFSHAADLA
jgi:hypothetical protein